MIIIRPSVEILTPIDGESILKSIEVAGRVCYKSEDKIGDGTAASFVKGIIDRGHEAVLEHSSISVRFVCDRGVSHELVRHRLASYCQESTRYCNYSRDAFGKEITVIRPCFFEPGSIEWVHWYEACTMSERQYFELLNCGRTPQEARSVLPNSLKTEVVMTADIREWRTVLKLRAHPTAHPQMRELMLPLLGQFKEKIPVLFDDIGTFLDTGGR